MQAPQNLTTTTDVVSFLTDQHEQRTRRSVCQPATGYRDVSTLMAGLSDGTGAPGWVRRHRAQPAAVSGGLQG